MTSDGTNGRGPVKRRIAGDPRAKAWWRARSPGRITNGLVGISSAAIVSVYAAGYLSTRSADDRLGAETALLLTPTPAAASAQAQLPTPTPFSRDSVQPPTLPSSTPAARATPAPEQTGGYHDGTFVGLGSSRHGGIEATVVIRGGKIVSASVSNCMTRYSCSKVSSLIGKVVAAQAVPVDYVSGATDSSRAYKQAVASALSQARTSG